MDVELGFGRMSRYFGVATERNRSSEIRSTVVVGFLKPFENGNGINTAKINRKRIRILLATIFVVSLFFGLYAASGASQVLGEYGAAAAYIEHSSSNPIGSGMYLYYYLAWWSPSHGNAVQSMINAIYATGMGFIIDGIAYLVNSAVGHQALVGSQAVAWVAALIVALYEGITGLAAVSEASAASGVAITLSSAAALTITSVALGYVAALTAA
ncbi:MAG: hypothetical protein B2I17_07600 [Thermoplasmatales archaeon B_DKE]|nr:MAG: hypothetical protein B2I17_07600 [Thermoplasmatales archaeon B_DKE]